MSYQEARGAGCLKGVFVVAMLAAVAAFDMMNAANGAASAGRARRPPFEGYKQRYRENRAASPNQGEHEPDENPRPALLSRAGPCAHVPGTYALNLAGPGSLLAVRLHCPQPIFSPVARAVGYKAATLVWRSLRRRRRACASPNPDAPHYVHFAGDMAAASYRVAKPVRAGQPKRQELLAHSELTQLDRPDSHEPAASLLPGVHPTRRVAVRLPGDAVLFLGFCWSRSACPANPSPGCRSRSDAPAKISLTIVCSAARVSGFMDLPSGSTSGVFSCREGRADSPRSRR